MSAHLFFSIIGWIAAFLGIPGTVVQYRRILKDGIEGISIATWLMFAMMCMYWIAYGFAIRSWVIVMGSMVVFPYQLLVISHLYPMKHLKVLFGTGALIFVCAWLPAMTMGWSAGLYGTGFAMVINRVPQLIELIRVKNAQGVSASSWAISSLGSLLWVIYYTSEHMWAPFFATAVSGIVNVLIVALTLLRHQQVKSKQLSSVTTG